ncbi:nuclear transport factor 2 family protein [Pandoraea communis]|uniref:nuclear transport factor 2 family protein n=1 Tax=Pandoraea communis TaxID=2508297 RepID=UPI0025A57B6D|nr:nuclear transport factor 2 family protein [Pandoraea communis]MDM8359121.1 nuclear transport factor 2 family protein [Pandoraea communis]
MKTPIASWLAIAATVTAVSAIMSRSAHAAEGMPPVPGAALSAAGAEGLSASAGTAPPVSASQMAANKQVVLAFYDAGLNRKDFDAARQYLGAQYIQHNPNAADGVEGFGKFLEFLRKNQPDSRSDVVRAFADGDYVILHVRKVPRPGDLPIAIVDIFRLDKGKIVEHWDVSQQVPAKTVSGNPMF